MNSPLCVQQALCIGITKICTSTVPEAFKPQPVRDAVGELTPQKDAHSSEQQQLLEVIELLSDSEDDRGPQTPAAADVYETPMMPLRQAAQGKRKIEWSPSPSDLSQQQAEEGLLSTQDEGDVRRALAQAHSEVFSQDGPRGDADVSQRILQADIAPVRLHVVQQPELSRLPVLSQPMQTSNAENASSSQEQPTRQETTEAGQAAKRQRCEIPSSISAENPSQLGPSDPLSAAPEKQTAEVFTCNEITSGPVNGASGLVLMDLDSAVVKPAQLKKVSRKMTSLNEHEKAAGAVVDESKQGESYFPRQDTPSMLCLFGHSTLSWVPQRSHRYTPYDAEVK